MKKIIILLINICIFSNLSAQQGGSTISESSIPNKKTRTDNVIDKATPTDTIFVIGSPNEAFLKPGSAKFMEKEEVKEFEYSDPVRLLQKVPGVYVQEEDGYGLRPNIGLRGATPHRSKKVTLMEDGVLIAPAPYSAPAAYFFPNMMRTQNVEVFKGMASTLYGPNSIGGAINFVTNEIPVGQESELAVTLGDINKFEISTGKQGASLGYLIEFNQAQADGFKELPNGADTGFEKNDLLVKLKYKLPKYGQSVNLKYSFANENSQETYLGLSEDDFAINPYARYAASSLDNLEWKHSQYQLAYNISPNQNIKFNSTLYLNQFERNWSKFNEFRNGVFPADYLDSSTAGFDPYFLSLLRGSTNSLLSLEDDDIQIGSNDREYYSAGAHLQTDILISQGQNIYHQVKVGYRYHQDQIRRNHYVNYYEMQNGSLDLIANSRVNTTQNQDTAIAHSIFLEDEIDFGGKFSLTLNNRFEDITLKREDRTSSVNNSQLNFQVIAPGVGVQYALTENLNLIAGVNRGVTIPVPGSAIDAKEEQSINYEVGAKYQGKVKAELIGFYNDYDRIKGFCSFSNGCQEENLDTEFEGGKAEIYGFESQAGTEFLAGKWAFPLYLSYTKTIAKFQSNIESQNREWGLGEIKAGDPMPYIPKDKVSLQTGLKRGKFAFSLIYNWQSGVYDQAVEQGRKIVQDFQVLDLIGRYNLFKSAQVFFKVDNVLNEEYVVSMRPYGLRPGKPQMLSGGFRYVF